MRKAWIRESRGNHHQASKTSSPTPAPVELGWRLCRLRLPVIIASGLAHKFLARVQNLLAEALSNCKAKKHRFRNLYNIRQRYEPFRYHECIRVKVRSVVQKKRYDIVTTYAHSRFETTVHNYPCTHKKRQPASVDNKGEKKRNLTRHSHTKSDTAAPDFIYNKFENSQISVLYHKYSIRR